MATINNLFKPKSVAVIGASKNSKKLGYTILKNIIIGGFKGLVYPINPKYKIILNKKCYPAVSAVKAGIDLAIIVIPAKFVALALDECGQKKIKNAIVVSAGFSEIGLAGKELDEQVKKIVAKHRINLLGPNCLGLLDSDSKLNASFAADMINPGSTAFISQSGAICTAILDWSLVNKLGFSKFISLGNKLCMDEVDFINYFINDAKTKVVLGYFEGINRGRDFIEAAGKLTAKKPLIVIKAGRSQAGQEAISSHTGSLAGDDKAIQAAFKKCNIIRAENLQEFFNLAVLFSCSPPLAGNKVAIITNAGGPSVITTDMLSEGPLELAQFSAGTTAKLKAGLPPTANINNPVDLIGDADASRYQLGIKTILSDKNVNCAIILLTPQTVTEVAKTAVYIAKLVKLYKKPVIACFIGGKRVAPGVKILTAAKVPCFLYPDQAVKTLELMHGYYQKKNKKFQNQLQNKKVCLDPSDFSDFIKAIKRAKDLKKKMLDDMTSVKLLSGYDLPVIQTVLVAKIEDIESRLEKIEYPLVAKISSQNILHKTDIGGVKINIRNINEAKQAFREVLDNVKKNQPDTEISGVVFQPMLKRRQEVILGATRDPQFGPMVMFGLGGIFVEIFKDVSFRLAPLSLSEAIEMVQETKAYKILEGARGHQGYDIGAIAENINRLSQLMVDFPEIKEIDINPALVAEGTGGLSIVDFKILV